MSATEELRRMLTDAGVEYGGSDAVVYFEDERGYKVCAYDAPRRFGEGVLCVSHTATPEQAIAAALGAGMLTAKQVMAIAGRHQPDYCSDTHACFDWQAIADELNATLGSCSCSNDCTNGERTDAPSLPHFWTHDGTLHVELPKLPESISVRLPDQRDREVGSARVWQYTLGNDGVGRTNDGLADLQAENAKLRELARGLHVAYIGIIGQCESFDSALTWGFSSDIDADLAKQHASYEQDRHRFDVAMRELEVEVDE